MQIPFLTLITFFPFLGAIIIMFINKQKDKTIKIVALISTFVPLALSIILYFLFDRTTHEMQFVERYLWIPSLNVHYHLGIDGLSYPLLFATALLSFLCMVYSWNISQRPKEYFIFFLILEVGLIGVFVALDFFLFYIFWEVSLVPMYFIIGIWGGPKREYAAIKFFLYTLVGSVAILLAILALYFNVVPHTFDMLKLAEAHPFAAVAVKRSLVFWAFFLGFAIKVPLFPFHTWLPDAHVEAPTAGSVLLAGILLKMGTYGFVRVSLTILPGACQQFSLIVGIIALINIIYGALVAMAQTDFKKLVAYSSINHMGYVMLGFAAASALSKVSLSMRATALNGAILEMFNHAVITGGMFFLVGVLYDRAHVRDLDAFGGLGAKIPIYSGILTTTALASLGLPALSGFVSEFLVFIGSFPVYKLITCLAGLGLIITAAFFLWMIQRLLLGELNPRWAELLDMDKREIITMAPLILLMLWIGVFPKPAIDIMNETVTYLLSLVH